MITDLDAIRAAMPWAPLPDDLRKGAPLYDDGWGLGHDVRVKYYIYSTGRGGIVVHRGTRSVTIERVSDDRWWTLVHGSASCQQVSGANLPTAIIRALGGTYPLHDDLLVRVAEVVGHITKQAAP